jgi:pimeloyl-ACP methyl ester carboxylesterase
MVQTTEKTENIGEHSVHYAVAGSGDPTVLLHGGDKRESWKVWEPLLDLSANRMLLMPDLVGFGGSSRPTETPGHSAQAEMISDLLERLGLRDVSLIGSGWGGQVAIELAMTSPNLVKSVVLIASTYDKEQLPRLQGLKAPTLIVWAEDDLVTQLKAGYLLRDAIPRSRLEVLPPTAKDPAYDFTIAHKLQRFRTKETLELITRFLADPDLAVLQQPEMENDLRGMALHKDEGHKDKPAA